jgi:hypothetical protein
MTEERRAVDRVPIRGELRGEITRYEPLAVIELGPRGVQVETGFPLHLDSLHDIKISLGSRSVVVKGRVVHSRISAVFQDIVAYRSSMEFVEPPDHVSQATAGFFDAIEAKRRE